MRQELVSACRIVESQLANSCARGGRGRGRRHRRRGRQRQMSGRWSAVGARCVATAPTRTCWPEYRPEQSHNCCSSFQRRLPPIGHRDSMVLVVDELSRGRIAS